MRTFRDFTFDPETGELRHRGVPQALQRQPARLLDLLTQRPGEIVRREGLRDELWPPGTHVDFERCINFYVRQVRRALGDDAKTSRFLETVPGVGYRFVAAIDTAEPRAEAPPEGLACGGSSDPLAGRPVARHRRLGLAATGLALLLGGLLGDALAGSRLDHFAAETVHRAFGIEAQECPYHRWKASTRG